jgi:hypothetical protein
MSQAWPRCYMPWILKNLTKQPGATTQRRPIASMTGQTCGLAVGLSVIDPTATVAAKAGLGHGS